MSQPDLLQVAVPSPLRRRFDYIAPPGPDSLPAPGSRVRVPFGRRNCVGVVLDHVKATEVPRAKLRAVIEVLDRTPILPAEILDLLIWSSDYFHHPIGEVVLGALPSLLRRGKSPRRGAEERWQQSLAGAEVRLEDLTRAPRQAALLRLLRRYPGGATGPELGLSEGGSRGALMALVSKGWVHKVDHRDQPSPMVTPDASAGPMLNEQQAGCVDSVLAAADGFVPFLLDGVTGSGKTEVYLAILEQILANGRQALVLIPEIGLTPQIVARFRARLTIPIVILHSGLPDAERARAWLAAASGTARVVIGTRSSVFVPLPRLGVIIVDEEHDASFKQQDGFRYSARDVSVLRAQRADIPVLLGSATPSMESLHNVARGRYRDLRLATRAGQARFPSLGIIDLRSQSCEDGVSESMMEAVGQGLAKGEQSLLFLNRRGFAPVQICRDCGWHGECKRCDANLVLHREDGRVRCHHCGFDGPLPRRCPDCQSDRLEPVGMGTQRVAEAITRRFPDARVARIDRDRVRRRGAMDELLEQIHNRRLDVLVGTQMLAKGHHFPNVTLVGIVDGDGGLFSADFRGPERMAQLLVQVAGRAGRGERPGRVLIQTHQPHHPLLQRLLRSGYRAFAEETLSEREAAQLPPFTSMALLRAEASRPQPAHRFLDAAHGYAQSLAGDAMRLLGPVPAPMERRAGRYRAHLLLESPSRAQVQQLLFAWLPRIESLPEARKVRWSLDVDPQELL